MSAFLRPRQAKALGLILAGRTGRQAALEVGVTDRTISAWMRRDPTFRAALEEARREMQAAVTARLLRLVDAALELLEYEVLEEGNLKAARSVLNLIGFTPPGR